MRTYAIGDIHGHLDKLRAAHDLIEADRARCDDAEAPVVHIGDFVDRGPDSAGVLTYLVAGQAEGRPWVNLLGNHDRMMRRFLEPDRLRDPLRPDLHWLQDTIGGKSTLASYGVETEGRTKQQIHRDARSNVPVTHFALLDSLLPYYRRGEVYYCHAGIRPGVPLDDQDEDDLVWIRTPFLMDITDHGVLIVHGHSPISTATLYPNRLNIDSGAAYGGPLSAVVIEDRTPWILTETGRLPFSEAAHYPV